MELSGHNALVTGGGSGLGLACARRLLRDGATVTIVGRGKQRLKRAAAELEPDAPAGAEVRTAVCDVTDEAAAAVHFLSGPHGAWTTGVSLPVDGGLHLRRGPTFESYVRGEHGTTWLPDASG